MLGLQKEVKLFNNRLDINVESVLLCMYKFICRLSMNEQDLKDVIVATKRHIRNLIQGNGLSKQDIRNLFNNEMTAYVKDQVKNYIAAWSLDELIKKTIHLEVSRQVGMLIRHSYRAESNTVIQDMVREEINKEVQRIVKENFEINVDLKKTEVNK